ncbi:hypothetical protein Acsp05_16210 [Actinokineospora sp. NBRC 105648]|nr:hypothetical protein [Actinokineospora sp. NBRC 105648]GLZ37997.1 hypothetical protein Acsp05_16210 [Actinokineospora sp. NBRC 105648]
MTAHDAGALVRRMQECFNTREFDQADDLFTPDFFSHPLGTTGFGAGKRLWHGLVAHFPTTVSSPRTSSSTTTESPSAPPSRGSRSGTTASSRC